MYCKKAMSSAWSCGSRQTLGDDASSSSLLNQFCLSNPSAVFESASVSTTRCVVRMAAGRASSTIADNRPTDVLVWDRLPEWPTMPAYTHPKESLHKVQTRRENDRHTRTGLETLLKSSGDPTCRLIKLAIADRQRITLIFQKLKCQTIWESLTSRLSACRPTLGDRAGLNQHSRIAKNSSSCMFFRQG